MTDEERACILEKMMAYAPKGLGLAKQMRKNLASLSDDELRDAYKKSEAIASYVKASAISRPDTTSRRAALAARRAERYRRIAALARPEATQAHPVATVESAAESVVPSLQSNSDLKHTLAIWNTYDRTRSLEPIKYMRHAACAWLDDFGGKVLGTSEPIPLFRELQGPLLSDFDQYLEFAIDRVGRDALRIIRNYVVHGHFDSFASIGPEAKQLIILSALADEALEPGFIASVSGRVRETAAIDGLAKLRSFALDYRPDIIVSVAGGGKIVGDFIAAETKLGEKHIRTLDCRHANAKMSGGWRSLVGYKRLLLVDDIAGHPDTLCGAHHSLTHRLDDCDIQMVAFASTLETRDQLIEEGHENVFVAHFSADRSVDLPWGRTGQYEERHGRAIFGAGSAERLSVEKAQIRRVSSSLSGSGGASRVLAEG